MILNFEEKRPIISEESFVAQNATVVGEVITINLLVKYKKKCI